MEIKCKHGCDPGFFSWVLSVTIDHKGNITDKNVLDFDLDKPEDFIECPECGLNDIIIIER